MKITSTSNYKIVLVTVVALFVSMAAATLSADQWDARHHYRRDNYGYWDGPHYHHYGYWHHHHGYWDTRGSGRIFINVD